MSANLRRFLPRGALLGLAFALTACSQDAILAVDNPTIIDPDDVLNAAGAPAIYAGAVSEITTLVSGNVAGGLAIFTGLFTDEVMHASTPPEVRGFDLRDVLLTNGIPQGLFLGVQRVRFRNERAARLLTDLVGASDKRVGEVSAIAGWSYILLAEIYCSAVPISNPETEELGFPLTTNQLLDSALARLTSAAASTGGDARIVNLIALLRGRALLNKADFAGAAQAVASVPTSYVYQFLHSTTTGRQANFFPAAFTSEVYSVPDREGTNGMDFVTANDPRVPTGPGSQTDGLSRNDRVTPMRRYTRYATAADPYTAASGIEARLIEAEAALPAAPATWLAKLNEARATIPALTPLVDPGTATARVDLTFRERAFWLYLTVHRLGDLRRLVRQYGRSAESVFPTAAYHKQGLVRGTQVAWFVPQNEDNNPNFDRTACDPTQP